MKERKVVGWIPWDPETYKLIDVYKANWWEHYILPKIYNYHEECEKACKPGQICLALFIEIDKETGK